jgi:hypothetical protein
MSVITTVSQAKEIALVCNGKTMYPPIGQSKTSEDEVLIFDLDRRTMRHGSEEDTYPLTKIDSTTLVWKNRDGTMQTEGRISRVNLQGEEDYRLLDRNFRPGAGLVEHSRQEHL